MKVKVATTLGVAVLAVLSILRVQRTPKVVPAGAPDTVFSAERAMHHVEQIAQRPHAMGTADHDRVRDYIAAQLQAMNIKPQFQTTTAVGTRYQASGRVQNVLGYLPGSSSNGKAVLLVAHYDGVEAGPAASDDGAGAAALLETLRAMRARRAPLKQDVIALFTDGEESGLLGAAAFVREHKWASDVAFVLNFEARGTTGRSYMFETGAGNLDAVRALRSAGDVTAGSVFTTIYRSLPNDTDLSEFAQLGVPALNFAFADGVERYHTDRDDVAHLNPGSLQHHGQQMLRVGTTVAMGDLPRPTTGDAVFFDFPFVGLVVYPVWLAIPLAIVALVLFISVARRGVWDIMPGAGAMLVVLIVTAAAAKFVALRGPAMWSGVYGAALALIVIAVNASVYLAVVRRRKNAYVGVLAVWLVLALLTSITLPGVSYMFTWPLLFALIAERSRRPIAMWISAAFAILLLAGFTYAASVVMLGVSGAGAIALTVLTGLLTWLVAPLIGRVFDNWRQPLATLVPLAVVVALIGLAVVKQSPDHPARSSLVYAENADGGEGFFGSYSPREPWTGKVLGAREAGPSWTNSLLDGGGVLYGHPVPRASLDAPTLTYVRDTILDGARRVIVRVNAPRGTTAVIVRALGEPVLRAAIDARVVDTMRLRRPSPEWSTEFWNVPDSGAVFSLAIEPGKKLDLEVAARRPGLPAGLKVPSRPADVAAAGTGDVSISYRRATF